jgi:hypothetical protein
MNLISKNNNKKIIFYKIFQFLNHILKNNYDKTCKKISESTNEKKKKKMHNDLYENM